MLKIGITGGIGSGKSMVCEVLEKIGCPVYYSDKEAKLLVDTHPIIRKELIDVIDASIYSEEGLVRPRLAQLIFEDDSLREQVNAIIHPRVRAHFSEWVAQQSAPLIFNEAAIFFETGSYKQFDKMVLVTAPEELRIERVMKRDGVSREQVLDRMSKQWPDEQKIPLADYVVMNDGRPLLQQIEEVLESLTQLHEH